MYNKGAKSGPGKVVAPNKLWHAFKHKNLDVFKLDLDAEEDQNYVSASERFMELQTQLGMVLHHTESFRKTLEESLQQAVELADDFGRISSGQGNGRAVEPWATMAGKRAFFLKGMLEESVESLRQHLHLDLEERVIRSLREEVAAFCNVHNQMNERANMKVEMLHYSKKLEELRGVKNGQKNIDEKMDRNKEKYAQASQALRDQTNQLMSVFAHAEQLRERLLSQDLPSVILCKKDAFDALAVNMNKAHEADGSQHRLISPATITAAVTPHNRSMASGEFLSTPPVDSMADVSLEDSSPTAQAGYVSPLPMKMDPPPPYDAQPTIVKKRSPAPMSPTKSGAPWSGSANEGGEFGQELKRAHEHQNSKMAAENAASATTTPTKTSPTKTTTSPSPIPTPTATATASSTLSTADVSVAVETAPERTTSVEAAGTMNGSAGQGTTTAVSPDSPTPERPEVEIGRETSVLNGGSSNAVGPGSKDSEGNSSASAPLVDEEVEEQGTEDDDSMEELEPGKVRVRALYDYEATQDGDLSFHAGDIIITDGGAFSGDGWVSGECDGRTGIFPANYTEPW